MMLFFYILPLKYSKLSRNVVFFYIPLYIVLWTANLSVALILAFVPFSAMFACLLHECIWDILAKHEFLADAKKKHVYSLFMLPHTNPIMQWCGVGSCVHLFFPVWLHSSWDCTHCLCSNWPRLFLSTCWPAQVSPRPRMPLNPQQPSAFCLQLPETDPELLCLCSHTRLHWYAEAGINEKNNKRKQN